MKAEQEIETANPIDYALAQKLGRDALLKIKAMQMTMQFLIGRTMASPETLEQLYDKIYNKLKNGATKKQQRPQIR